MWNFVCVPCNFMFTETKVCTNSIKSCIGTSFIMNVYYSVSHDHKCASCDLS